MIWIGRGVVISLVATHTGIRRVGIVAADMAVGAVGYAGVRTGERPDGIVIESRRRPCIFIVALGAIGGELVVYVVGVGRGIEIGLVTAGTGIGGVVVIAVVAGRAVIGNGSVRTVELVVVVVDGECRRHPAIAGMTGFAIGWDAEYLVVWVNGSVVVRLVATGAGIWRIGIVATDVAVGAVRHVGMRSGKWPNGIVVEGGRRPGIFIVTLGTIGWKLVGYVVGVGRGIKIGLVTAGTGIWRVVEIAADMAIGAIGHIGMRAIEGPDSVVIEG